jgi:hypothetical protein
VHFPTIVMPTVFQELRSCPGSLYPCTGYYSTLLKSVIDSILDEGGTNTILGKLYKCQRVAVRTRTAHERKDMSVYFPPSFKVVSLT